MYHMIYKYHYRVNSSGDIVGDEKLGATERAVISYTPLQ